MNSKKERTARLPRFGEAFFVVALLMAMLIICNIVLVFDAQISLLLGTIIACAFAFYLGHDWQSIENMIFKGLNVGLIAMLINLLIGMLISSWCASGTVGYLIYLSLKMVSPKFFLFTTLVSCCILSACTGSSWTTAGTVGIAMLGAGTIMGVNPAMICGAILAGCYFGDKISPISESTNCASAVAGTKLLEHVNSMTYVIFTSTGIVAIVYLVIGFCSDASYVPQEEIAMISNGLSDLFWFSPILLIPLVILFIMIIKKCPALLTMGVAIGMGIILSMLFQKQSLGSMVSTLMNGFAADTEIEAVAKMLKKGGLNNMRNVITVMLCGLPMGGVLEGTQAMEVIVNKMGRLVDSVAKTIAASTICACLMAVVTGDTYPAYILTAAAFGKRHDDLQLDRKVLSRTLEMAVVCNCLVPWTAGGVYMSELFGLSPSAYAPYYFWGFLVPLCNIALGCIGWGVFYTGGRRGWGKNKYVPQKIALTDKLEEV